ncbi:MAG: hypothetical protein QW351_01820 [Candidatus Caldarchaeum sp.]
MAAKTKKEILKLLKEDEEFRYAVAGLIGLEETLRRLDKLDQRMTELHEQQVKLWEELRTLREGQEKLWEEVRSLREGEHRLWEEVKSLREGQEKLWENQGKLWEEVKSLREGQEKLWETQSKLWEEVKSLREGQEKLWENQSKLWEEVRSLREGQNRLEESMIRLQDAVTLLTQAHRELAKQVGALSETVGFGLEDIAKVVVPGWLQRHEGIVMAEEFVRRWITVDGEEIEVNLYGEGVKNGRKLVIVGEAKSRIYKREVEAFDAWAEKVSASVGGEVYKFMFGYLIHPSAEEEGRRRKITLIASYMR